MKKIAIVASVLALLAPGCIVVDDEGLSPCEVAECADATADSSPQDSGTDTAVDSAIEDAGLADSSIDTGTVSVDSGIDSTIDSAADSSMDLGVDTSMADTKTPDAADTAVVDTGTDTGAADTGTADTGADTFIEDTFTPDTSADDTLAADTLVEDTSSADSSPADTADSSPVDSGAGDTADAAPTCPTGKGSAMVRVSGASDGGTYSFCVDKYETTNADYAAFLATSPAATGQPTDCSGNITFDPSAPWPAATGEANRPVVNVDWCDATAYCKWAGKRLCGKIGGGGFNVAVAAESRDPLISEWENVCTAGDVAHAFPYGPTYSATSCRGASTSTVDVGSLTTCEGGYSGVFDMSGNAYEWLNACAVGATGNCLIAGGGFSSLEGSLRCDGRATKAKNAFANNTGIRCCAD